MIASNRPTFAVLYGRFSPRPNAAECESITSQLSDLRACCAKRGWSIVGEFSDPDYHGDDHQRPGLHAALDALRRGYVLLVREWDRLYRDTWGMTGFALDVVRRGARLVSATEGEYDPEDEDRVLLFELQAAIAKHRKVKIGKATSRGMLRKQAARYRMSERLPYGMMDDPASPINDRSGLHTMMIPCPEEQENIERARIEIAQGFSLREICRRFNANGVACRGGVWHHKTLAKILERLEPARVIDTPVFTSSS